MSCRPALKKRHAQDTKQCCFAPMLGYKTAVWNAKPHRCNSKDRKAVFSLGFRPALEQRAYTRH